MIQRNCAGPLELKSEDNVVDKTLTPSYFRSYSDRPVYIMLIRI